MAAVLALASSLAWGVGDFLGGRVASRAPALTVTAATQAAGLVLVALLAPVVGGEVSRPALLVGAGAGLLGGAGLVTYFRALAIGPMGVVAPLAGTVGALVPVTVGLARGEQVGPVALVGIALGLGAVVLATIEPGRVGPPGGPAPRAGRVARIRAAVATSSGDGAGAVGPVLGVVAGLLFGSFFVLLDATPTGSGLWPLVGARAASVPLLAALAVVGRRSWPSRADAGLVVASGLLDSTANALFLVATRLGLLALTGLLSSLYPVVIVLLARQVLGERLGRLQVAGVVLAMGAVVLVTLG